MMSVSGLAGEVERLRAELARAHDVIARVRAQAEKWVGVDPTTGLASMDLRAAGTGEANAGRVILQMLAGVTLAPLD